MHKQSMVTAVVVALALLAAACSNDDSAETVTDAEPTPETPTADPTVDSHGDAHGESSEMPGMTDEEHAAMSAEDDRGFSALDNGEQYGHDVFQPISPVDRIELARQLTLAREVALQYPTVAEAEAAGLRRSGPFSPGLGAHYISFENVGGDTDGVMSDDDIRRPLAWMYDGTTPDARVAGLFYGRQTEDGEGFAGPNDTWHIHRNVCLVTGPNGIDTPLGADRDATVEACDAVGGSLLERTQYLAHVWVVPGFESPEGVFAHLSSAVTCDDGTYHTIDVTQTGVRASTCVSGSE